MAAVVSLSPIFNGFQAFTSGGVPLAGGLLNTYLAGTVTPVTTYTDSAGLVANSNPIVLDAGGRPPSEIWLVAGAAIKFVLTDSAGANSLSYDNIRGVGDLTIGIVDLTTTGNTILGDQTTDTLTVGVSGIVKDASGNVGFGGSPSANFHLQRTGATVTERIEAISSGSAFLEMRASTAGGFSTQITFYNVATPTWGTGGGNIGTAGANDFSVYNYNLTRNVFTIGYTTGDITALGVGIARSKSAVTSRNTTTTLADDPDLIVPLSVGRWTIECYMPWNSTAGGLRFAPAFSGTQTNITYGLSGYLNSVAFFAANANAISTFILATSGAGDWATYVGEITVSVAGNLSLQWAQGTSSATATILGAGAYLRCVKVG